MDCLLWIVSFLSWQTCPSGSLVYEVSRNYSGPLVHSLRPHTASLVWPELWEEHAAFALVYIVCILQVTVRILCRWGVLHVKGVACKTKHKTFLRCERPGKKVWKTTRIVEISPQKRKIQGSMLLNPPRKQGPWSHMFTSHSVPPEN